MSSCRTVPTSTTASSTSSPSPADPVPAHTPPPPAPLPASGARSRSATHASDDPAPLGERGGQAPLDEGGAAGVAVIACGALAQGVAGVAARRGWALDVHPLPPLLHNQPRRIAGEVEALASGLAGHYQRVVVGYTDCGTYGALDEVCQRLGLSRLAGLHCYDVYGGSDRLARWFDEQPGTYVLTDFLVRSFDRAVLAELGLDRHPELREAYFAHYTQTVWLAQRPTAELRRRADQAAAALGLPLRVVEVGDSGLEQALADVLADVPGDVLLVPSARPGTARLALSGR